jgi:hypothetical protein
MADSSHCRSERVEEHVPGVAVAVRAHRRAEPVGVLVVVAGAGQVAAMRAGPPVGVAAGAAGQASAAVHRQMPAIPGRHGL